MSALGSDAAVTHEIASSANSVTHMPPWFALKSLPKDCVLGSRTTQPVLPLSALPQSLNTTLPVMEVPVESGEMVHVPCVCSACNLKLDAEGLVGNQAHHLVVRGLVDVLEDVNFSNVA